MLLVCVEQSHAVKTLQINLAENFWEGSTPHNNLSGSAQTLLLVTPSLNPSRDCSLAADWFAEWSMQEQHLSLP